MKKYLFANVVIFLIFIFLFIFISIYDFQISALLADLQINQYYTTNIFAIFFEVFGEFPLFFSVSFCMLLFLKFALVLKNKYCKVILVTLFFVMAIFVNFVFFARCVKYLSGYVVLQLSIWKFCAFAVGVVVTVAMCLLVKKIPKEHTHNFVWFACFVVLVALFSCIVVQVLKSNVWCRVRYRAMNAAGDFSLFSPWWQPNFNLIRNGTLLLNLPADACRSFPSGHAASVVICFCFLALPKFLNVVWRKKVSIRLCGAFAAMTIVVCFSRIVAGAHFASDVLCGVLITWVFMLLFYYLFKVLKRAK